MEKLLFILLFGGSRLIGAQDNEVEQLSAPGKYSQWREKIPIESEEAIPDCQGKCNERCGSDHKGVSICSSMFEFADSEPQDPKSEVINIPTPFLAKNFHYLFFFAGFICPLFLPNVYHAETRPIQVLRTW